MSFFWAYAFGIFHHGENAMLEIVQAGQAGKTSLLFDMHRLRKRVFKDRLGWPVSVDHNGLEIDQFDLPETVYVLALDDNRRVIGNWRLLPTTGPTMVRDVWPQFLKTIDMPQSPYVWESSRFAVDSLAEGTEKNLAQVNKATQELFCGVAELCLMCGIEELFALYDIRIARILKRIDCPAKIISERMHIDSIPAEVGVFTINYDLLSRLRKACNITSSLVPPVLPPILQKYLIERKSTADIHASRAA